MPPHDPMVGPTSPLWEDLVAFHTVAEGVRAGKTLQQIAADPRSLVGSTRMLYLRLSRLEHSLNRRLVDRRPWGRDAHLTETGADLAEQVAALVRIRQQIEKSSTESEVAVLRIATHSTLISTLLPTVMEQYRESNQGSPGLSLELELVRTYADVLSAVDQGRVDAGLYLMLPGIDEARLPRNVRQELLGQTDLLVVFHHSHHFATDRQPRARVIRIDELANECVITRGYLDAKLPPADPRGSRITVPHSLDALAFVRLGIGVSLYPRLAYELLGESGPIHALPLDPRVRGSLVTLQPRKRLRPLTDAAEQFLENLRRYSLARLRRKS